MVIAQGRSKSTVSLMIKINPLHDVSIFVDNMEHLRAYGFDCEKAFTAVLPEGCLFKIVSSDENAKYYII